MSHLGKDLKTEEARAFLKMKKGTFNNYIGLGLIKPHDSSSEDNRTRLYSEGYLKVMTLILSQIGIIMPDGKPLKKKVLSKYLQDNYGANHRGLREALERETPEEVSQWAIKGLFGE